MKKLRRHLSRLKKWFRLRDSYGVAIDPVQEDVIILAVAVCIDEMSHAGR